MKQKAIFYHAGCPVCVTAEQTLLGALDRSRIDVEVVHLGTAKERLAEATAVGVQSVPALVLNGQTLHVNYGAPLSALQ